MTFVREIADSKVRDRERRRNKAPRPPDEPKREYFYSTELLETARILFEVEGRFVINPRDMYCANLLLADQVWRRDFSRYLAEHELQEYLAEHGG